MWRARDSRLGRDVAVKISDAQFTDRFEKEARAIAALNHPNICTLFDVGPNYLVMELIDGPTLGDRIQEGAIPLEEALGIARQIADALEAAHEKGIVHRDLKPGNVKIRPDGSVKVLDFGLAKDVFSESKLSGDSPTLILKRAVEDSLSAQVLCLQAVTDTAVVTNLVKCEEVATSMDSGTCVATAEVNCCF